MQQWIDGWVSISRVGQPKENRSNLALTHKLSKVQQAISATFFYSYMSRHSYLFSEVSR